MLRAVFSHLVWTKVLIESSSKGLGHTQLLLITHHVGSSVSTFLVLNTLKIFLNLFILFLAVLGLQCCSSFSLGGVRGSCPIAGLVIIVAFVAKHGLQRAWA